MTLVKWAIDYKLEWLLLLLSSNSSITILSQEWALFIICYKVLDANESISFESKFTFAIYLNISLSLYSSSEEFKEF